MSATVQSRGTTGTGLDQIVFCLRPAVELSDDQLFKLCQANRELRIEQNQQGELIIMLPAGGESSSRNLEISMQLANWTHSDKTGIAFDSSAGFRLPKGGMRSPDASWIRLPRWKKVPRKDRKIFAPICPDFVVELRSETDRLRTLQAKLQEYIDNGAELGLLIDPLKRKVHIYRPDQEPEILNKPKKVSCQPELPGFELDLREIW